MVTYSSTKMAELVQECLNQHFLSFLSYVDFSVNNKLVFGVEDSKLEEILEKVISKTSNVIDEKFSRFKHSLRNDIVNLRND